MPTQHLPEILILLGIAVVVVALFRLLKLSPVLGYLVAGATIGPSGLGLITHVETTSTIAEFGVVFLLFMIGLELSLERLRTMRRLMFGFGTAQVLVTALIIAAAVVVLGNNIEAAIIIAGGLALSSTAIVLQVIEENRESSTQVGRLSLATLLLQDFAVVPLLVLVPLLVKGAEGSIAAALFDAGLRAITALIVIFVVGRLLLRPLFHFIASFHNAELFLATTLLIVLGIACATQAAGLSLALGAFVAGLLVAETEFQHQVEADIAPYRGLFLGLFFMTVGMSVDVQLMLSKFSLILELAFALMAAKALVVFALCRLFRFTMATAVHTGLLLAQGGEFAFVLFGLAAESGVIDKELSQILLVMVTVSMAFTPLLALAGKNIARRLEKRMEPDPETMLVETQDLEQHVIIAGFGRRGQVVAKLLGLEKINYIALELNPADVAKGRERGKIVYYGDASRMDVLKTAGIERAKCVIITLKNNAEAQKTIATVRTQYADMPIIVCVKDIKNAEQMRALGATIAVAEIFEGSLQIGGVLLHLLGVPNNEIDRIIHLFRLEGYGLQPSEESLAPSEE